MYIPVDRKLFKACHLSFNKPKRFTSKHDVGVIEGSGAGRFWVFKISGDGNPEFWFDMAELASLKGGSPTLGRRSFEMLLGMIWFAKRDNGLRGHFRAAEMARFLREDPPNSGRLYDDIKRTFLSLATVKIRNVGLIESVEEVGEEGIRFIEQWEHDPKGEGYNYTLNPLALGITALWLNDELREDNIGHGYINYPLAYVKERLGETEKAFRDSLLLIRQNVTVRAWTIAKNWCCFSDDALKRRRQVHDRIFDYLGRANKRGDIISWESTGLKLNTWKSEWKITISKPREPRRKKRIEMHTASSEDKVLINKIYKWQRMPIHRLKWSDEELLSRITNTVMAYGAEFVVRLYEEHGLGAYPSVHKFWLGVKELKASRVAQAEEAEADYAPV